MQDFKTYEEAASYAQEKADKMGFDYGVEFRRISRKRPELDYWAVFVLPSKKNRRANELTCEVRMCTDISKCRPGHGPMGL